MSASHLLGLQVHANEPSLDDIELESESEEEVEDMDDQNMEIDDENDRVYNVNLVGTKIRGLYEGSGWNTGTIKYYNSKLDKYLLGFDDGSDDLIREEDIDDVELFFVDKPKRSQRVDYSAMAKGH